jgi:gamma-glutamyltranspeptidase/glutathione hydrolase
MVVAGSPYAAQIGAEILERGGNAVDAAVATAFALTVAEPGMSGLGGRTVMIVALPDGRVEGLNGATAWPERWVALHKAGTKVAPPKGWGQVAVPGTVAALAEANRKWGSLPLRELIRPSVRLARDGVLLTERQAGRFKSAAKALAKDPTLRSTFLHPDGSPYRAGELLRQPDLAHTLELIAGGGPDVFYRGEIARAIVAEMEKHRGYVTLADLDAYRARPADLASTQYGNYYITAVGRPAMGGALIWCINLMSLLPLSHLDRFRGPNETGFTSVYSPVETAHAEAEILSLLSYQLHDEPLRGTYGEGLAPGELLRPPYPNIARKLNNNVRNRTTGIPRKIPPEKDGHTTHLVVADSKGGAVSLTQTLGDFFGPKVALPGYGITFAGTMGSLDDTDVSQGPFSSITPVLVFPKIEGRIGPHPILAIGAAGGDRIPGTVFQVLHNVLDEKMDLQTAVAAPRMAFDTVKGRTVVYLEPGEGWDVSSLIRELKKRGIHAEPLPKGGSVARVHALMRLPNGEWIGAPDPRWTGIAASPVSVPSEVDHQSRDAGAQRTP